MTSTGEDVVEPPDDDRYQQTLANFRAQWLRDGELEYLRRLLNRHDGNVASAALEAELSTSHLYRVLRRSPAAVSPFQKRQQSLKKR
jgi:DNA-binding phage protein